MEERHLKELDQQNVIALQVKAEVGTTVKFSTDQRIGPLITWGDGSQNALKSHTYKQNGLYTIIALFPKCDEVKVICDKITYVFISKVNTIISFTCTNSLIEKMDIRSHQLLALDCSGNKLTHLDTATIPKLVSLKCSNNLIQELQVKNAQRLTLLECDDNRLEKLDVTGCENLWLFNCNHNQLGVDALNAVYKQLQALPLHPGAQIACQHNPGFLGADNKILLDKNWVFNPKIILF